MSSEEWLILHGRYEKYARPIFRKALRESYSNTMTMIPLIDYQNYKELIPASFNYAVMNQAYVKVYTRVGLVHGKRVGAEMNRDLKRYVRDIYESTFMRSIYEWVQTNLGLRITQVNEYTIELIQQLVTDSLDRGYSVSQMRAYLQRRLNSPAFTRMRSLRIARTETTTAANHGAYVAAGESDLVLDKLWISVIDDRTRPVPGSKENANHRIQNGKTSPKDENFVMSDGTTMMFPGDPKAAADQVINCRCSVGYVPRRDNNGLLIFKN